MSSVPIAECTISTTDLTWETLADVSTATMNVTKLTLKGTFADGAFTVASGSYTAAKKPVTLKLTSGAIKATGMSSETGDVTTSAAPDDATGADKASIASSSLKVTIGTEGANSKVEGTITLAESKALTDLNGLTTLVFKNVKIGEGETAYDMTLTGTAYDGTSDSWAITGISFEPAEEAPAEDKVEIKTIKYSSGENVTATGTYEYASGGPLELQGSSFTPACEGKLTVTVAESSACTVAAEGFKIPATAKDTLSSTGLTWSGSQSFDSATIEKVVIKGTYTEADGGTLTISSLEINEAAEPVTVNLETGNTDVTVEGAGAGSAQVNALTTGSSITLTTENLNSKETVESVSGLTITFTEAKKASVAGTLTLASGKESTENTLVFDQGSIAVTGTGADSVGTIESVTLTGESGSSGNSWTLQKITITAEAKG